METMKFKKNSIINFPNISGLLGEYLEGHNGFIAGGCFKNLLSGEKVKDIDIFFRNSLDYSDAVEYFESLVRTGEWEERYSNERATAYQEKGSKLWVELVRSIYGSPEFILSNFDFTITKFAYYIDREDGEENEKVVYHEDFFEHLHMKRLVIDEGIPFPVSTWERSYRYKGYGYNLCRESKQKLLRALRNTEEGDEDLSLYNAGGWD